MRRDVYIINDARSWSVIAADAVDSIIADARENDDQFVQAFQAALFNIEGDDYSVIRIVANEPLTETEATEWIARICWRLKISDGRILISGGFDPDCLVEWQDEAETECVKQIEVAPGDYQIVFYTYIHSMNGAVWFSDLYDASPFPKLLPWFQKDHPGRPLPTWAVPQLQEEVWESNGEKRSVIQAVKSGDLPIDRQPLHWIGYLIHLIPFEPDMKLDTPEEGWFDSRVGLRVPERCPLGISTDCTEDTQVQSDLNWLLQSDA